MTINLIGNIYQNNNGEEYTVIEKAGVSKSGNIKYLIKFANTGYETIVEPVQIKRGKIKDRYSRVLFNIGYIGNTPVNSNKRAYNIWYKMLSRCYNESDERYDAYGKIGTSVDYRWHCFENFVNDIPFIDGYDEGLFNSRVIELDKDKKQLGKSCKIYSLETCTFLTGKENLSLNNDKLRHGFTATSPNGEIYEAFGIKAFCREHNLTHQRVILCLKGKAKTHKGWTFSY